MFNFFSVIFEDHHGSPEQMAPEQYTLVELTAKVDIWAIGVCIFRLLTGEYPFGFADYEKINQNILKFLKNRRLPWPWQHQNGAEKMARQLADTILQEDPLRRPTANKVKNHMFCELRKVKAPK